MSSIAIGLMALGWLTAGQYDIAIGDGAAERLTKGSCVIIVGENINAPTPETSFYINVDGVEYPNSTRAELWFQKLARERAHALVERWSLNAGSYAGPRYDSIRTQIREEAHKLIDEMSFFVDECGAEKVS